MLRPPKNRIFDRLLGRMLRRHALHESVTRMDLVLDWTSTLAMR